MDAHYSHAYVYVYNHVYPVHYWTADTLTSPYSMILINANFMFVRSEVSLSTDTSLAFHLQNDASVFSMLSRAIPLSNTSLSEHILNQTDFDIHCQAAQTKRRGELKTGKNRSTIVNSDDETLFDSRICSWLQCGKM